MANYYGVDNVRINRCKRKGGFGWIEVHCAYHATSKVKDGKRERNREFTGVYVSFCFLAFCCLATAVCVSSMQCLY